MIGIALAIFLTGMLIWRKCTNKVETPTPTQSAPPMLTQSLLIANLVTTNQATKSNSFIPISINIGKTPQRKGEILEQYSKQDHRRI